MTELIVHLNKEQTRIERRKLLADDIYILFCEFLKEQQRNNTITLSYVEAYISARRFACMLISLPNVMEGIDDELEDLETEAETENDAMIISMLAAAIIYASKRMAFKSLIVHIYTIWNDHTLFLPMLRAAAQKEEERWIEGKRVQLLSCELATIQQESENEQTVDEFIQFILDNSDIFGEDTLKEIIYTFSKYSSEHNNKYKPHIDKLYRLVASKANFKKVEVQSGGINIERVEKFTS